MTVSPARIVSSTFWLSGPDQQNCLDSDPVQCLKVPYNLTYINLCHYIVYLLKTHAAFPPRFINALVSCLIIVSLYPFDEIDPCLISRFHCLVKSLQQSCEFDEMLHQSIRRRTVTHPVRVDCYHFLCFYFLQLLRELNGQVSAYHQLATALGTASGDGQSLRGRLKRTRRRARQLASIVRRLILS